MKTFSVSKILDNRIHDGSRVVTKHKVYNTDENILLVEEGEAGVVEGFEIDETGEEWICVKFDCGTIKFVSSDFDSVLRVY